MDTNRPSDSLQQLSETKPFWRNVVLIALLHVALIAGFIRWSTAAKASSNPESIVWLGGAEDQKSESEAAPRNSDSSPETTAAKDTEPDEERVIAPVKSEIELPSPTPKPTTTPTPRPKATPTPTAKPKPTTKPIPKPTPKKTLVAKGTPKPAHEEKSTVAKSNNTPEKAQKKRVAKKDSAASSAADNNKPRSSGGVSAGASAKAGGSSASEFGWYGNMLHDRFYSAWIQPTTNVPSGSKFSALVQLRINKDGNVSKFEIIQPSDNAVVNESVAAVGKQVTMVDAPPTGLIKGDHYDVKINFELNTEEKAPN